jgi:O-antigen biosynthesis protein WbqP
MRIIDICACALLLIVFSVPALLVTFLIKLTSRGPVLYWSDRVGINNKIFRMPKFRSMLIDTPEVATHLLKGEDYLTPIGAFLRKSSLDELPQVYSVLVGDMSLVGPRPALFNQDELIELRTKCNVHSLRPGITGWAQINGRDEISIVEKVKLDEFYLENKSIFFDIKILFLTLYKVVLRKDISH